MRKQARQEQLPFSKGWSGRRKGSGRKLKNARPSVPHRRRVELGKPAPLHVNVRLKDGLPSLRRGLEHQTFRRVLARCRERKSFRVVHYVILFNHVHFIVEGGRREDIARGMGALLTSLAHQLNKLWKRKGKVFDGRYHDHVLGSPTETRNALAYVLENARRHGVWLPAGRPDPYSSGQFFTGWSNYRGSPSVPEWLAAANTWLLRSGWTRAGPLHLAFA